MSQEGTPLIRILNVTADLSYPRSGGQIYDLNVHQYLSRQCGYDVRILTPGHSATFLRRNPITTNFWFLRQFAQMTPDIIVEDSWLRRHLFLANCLGSRLLRSRLVPMVHDTSFGLGRSALGETAARVVLTAFLRPAHAVITPSRYTEREVHSYGVQLCRTHVVRPARQSLPDPGHRAVRRSSGTVVLCVGKIQPHKGQMHFIQALASIRDTSVTAEIVGEERDPEYARELKQLATRLGLGGRISFTGRLEDPADLACFYQRADILVVPSLHEGYGMAVVEGMSFGLPVVASNVGGIPEIIEDSVNGLLVPPGNPRALAAAITKLLECPEMAGTLGENAKRSPACKRTWEDVGKEYAAVLASLLPATDRRVGAT